jgi:alkyl hydroperoxide reductase subunit F
MLDQDLRTQLQSVLAGLGHQIELVVHRSPHEQREELLALLEAVAETSEDVTVRPGEQEAMLPQFDVVCDGTPTGVRFAGVPGGHEFTSLVLAIVNAAGKGKLPDAGLVQRIRALRGGITIRTYVSLACEICPDVVQALNQIAILHGGLEHVTVDGALVQDEVAALGIQGVPSVVVDGDLLHSGRATMAELLDLLEQQLGRQAAAADVDLGVYDVAVVGGGPAGVSAAIYSARKGLKTVLVAERVGGQLRETRGIENLISVVYTEGATLSVSLDQHLRAYPIEVLEHRRVREIGDRGPADGKEIRLEGGERLRATTLIVATGARWRELGVPGEKEYLGRGVAFCPHCDGPYYKGKRVAVVGGGNSGVEAAIDLAGICRDVVLLEFLPDLKADAVLVEKLRSLANVQVVTSARTTAVVGNGEKVVALFWEDRTTGHAHERKLDGVFVQIGLSPNSAVVKGLVETTKHGEIVVDAKGRTSVPGIYAAGDVTTTPYKQIVVAMGDGAKVALAAFEDRMRCAAAATGVAPRA